MTPDGWILFWGVVIAGGVGGFLVLAVIVAIGGYRDVRAMISRIDRSHQESESPSGSSEP
jgi:hypothetical protein